MRRPRGQARARIVAAGAAAFNEHGYDGTDSNAIARAAGYAPATFYRHFDDKRALFLEVFGDVVDDEWRALRRIADHPDPGPQHAIARALLAYHRRWRVFRASLRRLVLADDEVRDAFRRRRRAQAAIAVATFGGMGIPLDPKNAAALILVSAAVADAAADGELRAYGFTAAETEALLGDLAAAILDRSRKTSRRKK